MDTEAGATLNRPSDSREAAGGIRGVSTSRQDVLGVQNRRAPAEGPNAKSDAGPRGLPPMRANLEDGISLKHAESGSVMERVRPAALAGLPVGE